MDEIWRARFWANVVKTDSCWLWQTPTTSGYGQTHFQGKTTGAHRVSWELSNGPIPVGLVIMHKCDVRNCVNPDHLRLGTQSENIKDAISKGRRSPTGYRRHPRASGDASGKTKIPDASIPDIRVRAACGEDLADIAAEFGVTRANIYSIVMFRHRAGV